MSIGDCFNPSAIAALAGDRAHQRGVGYHADGRVELGTVTDDTASAVVRGTMPYRVELACADGAAAWSCDCPAAEDGSFCKHCVAVALSVMAGPAPKQAQTAAEPASAGSPVEDYLGTLHKDRLVDLLLDRAAADWRFKERLLADAQALGDAAPSVSPWKRRIDAAFAPYGDFVSYRDAPTWAAGVHELIDDLEDLFEAGQGSVVAPLAEHAYRCADEAMQYLDDSDGWLIGISESLRGLHFAACAISRPDPLDLAKRLVDLELTTDLEGFSRAAATYADVLGTAGLDEYRKLLEPHVASRTGNEPPSGRSLAIRNALIGWAMGTGDPEAVIEVRKNDLRVPGDYLEIARVLKEADRVEESIEWCRRGLAEHSDRPWQLGALREFLSGLLRMRGERDASVDLFWQAFESAPSLSTYRRLLDEVVEDRDQWSNRCIDALRSLLGTSGVHRSFRRPRPADALVDILMFEDDIDGAWTVAREYGRDRRRLMTLARAREADHPLDAIDVYEFEVLALINHTKNNSYRAAVDLMIRIERLAGNAAVPERFASVLHRVRTEHGAKRNLRAMLDARGWP